MAGPNDPPVSAVRVDVGALQTFANELRGEAATIGGLQSGLAEAAGALPGTQWSVACGRAKDTVDKALHRIGDRLTRVADGVQNAGKALELTDQEFRDKLTTIGLHP
ncbi:WXG100 family type VII secretion target [Nocardia blacklockiae]|uniref:WXG100 family type VII secretion target n=1 Tax=Nocardia blacklockiae TaxID=480036 RepID=UPI001895DDF6|nr:WXG100 family type VII secretion target [Nocardia blacklockiae]MBF6172779.1 WXG100 family type VII secretion target [Nocardia blacklockiae]